MWITIWKVFSDLITLRVISVKFLLVISMLYKTVVLRITDMITQDESN